MLLTINPANLTNSVSINLQIDLTNEEFKASRNRFKGHMWSPQVFLQCQLQLIAERKELLPLSRAKAGVLSTHPCENNTESLYIKTYFLTLFFFLVVESKCRFLVGILGSGSHRRNKKELSYCILYVKVLV
jgi:hypothetical protein